MASEGVRGRARRLRVVAVLFRRFGYALLTRAQKAAWRLEDGPLGSILSQRAVKWLRNTVADNFARMKENEVLEVLEALDRAGVKTWLVGGWGVDALLERRTRRHRDLDLVVLAQDGSTERACAVLRGLGYANMDEGEVLGAGMPRRILLDDGFGRSVDVHPIDASTALFASGTSPGELDPSAFAVGTLAGRAVPCVSVTSQLSLKSYPGARSKDVRDVKRLKRLEPSAC